ncbi:hypothetical protein [Clostridium estertheticum]|uniref:hypothetical protein n=1 Tax=Clostridium estertheticum TaxID=238834 RepID=UPI001C6E4195|nr:hypothetical protein [Clostridium estertheticum]MBW9150990.1 hypothetical protein [Clostridium estertheticum]WLC84299.1 hypothetical protein KTC97_00310 [Clostridium estertheticum]
MKVVIYINNNKTIKKLASLTRKIHEEISDSNKVEIVITEKHNKEYSISQMNSADIIIIFAHGGSDRIYHDYTNTNNINDIIIDKSNANIFRNKKVIAFSCYTARELGPYAVNNQNCKNYLGFYNAINRDLLNQKTPPQVEYFFSCIYSEAFKNTMVNAINNKYTFGQIKKGLIIEMRKLIFSQVNNCGINGQRYEKCLIPDIIFSSKNTIDGIACFGDDTIPLW